MLERPADSFDLRRIRTKNRVGVATYAPNPSSILSLAWHYVKPLVPTNRAPLVSTPPEYLPIKQVMEVKIE